MRVWPLVEVRAALAAACHQPCARATPRLFDFQEATPKLDCLGGEGVPQRWTTSRDIKSRYFSNLWTDTDSFPSRSGIRLMSTASFRPQDAPLEQKPLSE
jgi:hypothetical protein